MLQRECISHWSIGTIVTGFSFLTLQRGNAFPDAPRCNGRGALVRAPTRFRPSSRQTRIATISALCHNRE
ncbi:DUF1534 domain-containing protein [Pseudomonas savastanoi]|nr:DUF1534 domain-containing protein [Pseudomonas amygdali pv. tabaci str. ATCC 11528]QOI07166.1 DUF1534 domain-containing protein [Pseudomonas savastanoi]